ncbi:hypothetical protein [Desulfotruncus arcticus]|uniref:hypothetical protein n=1 Tax=Desulfotruncus arcticus TaxID=341036 RepID=UPI000B854E4D|nr:hypothetical protein [Desulfotruncus arcticus]
MKGKSYGAIFRSENYTGYSIFSCFYLLVIFSIGGCGEQLTLPGNGSWFRVSPFKQDINMIAFIKIVI